MVGQHGNPGKIVTPLSYVGVQNVSPLAIFHENKNLNQSFQQLQRTHEQWLNDVPLKILNIPFRAV